ncbi:Trypsin 5G1 [Zancudomyces culisetae]|uniref:Trypsin 5G1 n=1 Tax=Zancudomyces culisetae TaxID=1213189 RepID=A0A1R1PLU8_ZANCU|nr:Trypsin 5G1 [Zancudomyces culisetae]|eukprot:OMH81948.1 Trypsin 5G1 [Zancudomyces culisetae]
MMFFDKNTTSKAIVTTLALSNLNPASAAAVSNSGLATNNLVNSTPNLQNNARILGGEPAKIEEFPYMGGIVIRSRDSSNFCTGSLISDKYVVTLSACFSHHEIDTENGVVYIKAEPGDISVTLGTDKHSFEADVQAYSAEKIITHPDYSSLSESHGAASVALIELSQPVPKDVATPAKIYSGKVTDDMILTTAGWGITSLDDESEFSEKLNKITVSPSSLKDCQSDDWLWTGNDGDLICVVVKDNKSIIVGDGGVPLAYTANGANLIVGLAFDAGPSYNSSSFKPGENGSLNYFTHVYNYVDWIVNVTGIDKSDLVNEKQTAPSGNSTNNNSTNSQDSSSSTVNSSSSISASFLSKPITPLLLAIPILVLSLL